MNLKIFLNINILVSIILTKSNSSKITSYDDYVLKRNSYCLILQTNSIGYDFKSHIKS